MAREERSDETGLMASLILDRRKPEHDVTYSAGSFFFQDPVIVGLCRVIVIQGQNEETIDDDDGTTY